MNSYRAKQMVCGGRVPLEPIPCFPNKPRHETNKQQIKQFHFSFAGRFF
ncbi:hypothetical protein SAMN05216436_11319 [bacterium A37T11]|nr:hypothetical protein SAMN05216436_11319 [bacterium A37T11]